MTSFRCVAASFALTVLVGHGAATALMRSTRDETIAADESGHFKLSMRSAKREEEAGCKTCVPLTNQGSHFTVEVMVGTPPRPFTLVADTGSNSLLLPSCMCQSSGRCSKSGNCLSTKQDTSLQVLWQNNSIPGGNKKPVEVMLTFGSGQVVGAIATDTAKVGSCSTKMDDGLLLMLDTQLSISGFFGGILGLGLPHRASRGHRYVTRQSQRAGMKAGRQDVIRDIIKRILGGHGKGGGEVATDGVIGDIQAVFGDPDRAGSLDDSAVSKYLEQILDNTSFLERAPLPLLSAPEVQALRGSGMQELEAVNESPNVSLQVSSFLDQAKINRFSMCFSDSKEGVLRFDPPAVNDSLATVGKEHWGLDFRGISLDSSNASQRLNFCREENMTDGQQTPCGVIPDSGTTMIMGPRKSVVELLGSVCDRWERCKRNYTALAEAAELAKEAAEKRLGGRAPWRFPVPEKAAVLKYVLMDCGSWMNSSEAGLGELPSLHFHVAAGDKQQALELKGADYVFETTAAPEENEGGEVDEVSSLLQAPRRPGGGANTVCLPAFGAMEYPTTANGDVWIFGLPLFYAYDVTYSSRVDPPTVAFRSLANSTCGSCSKSPAAQFLSTAEVQASSTRAIARRPRRLVGPPRMPHIDTSSRVL